MPVIEIEFACRCGKQGVDIDATPSPSCRVCGETRVARVYNCPPPRFTGCVSGPHAVTQAMEPVAIRVGSAALAPDVVPAAVEGVH